MRGTVAMDIHNYLNKDHKSVSKLMKKLLASKTVQERASIFAAIKAELIAEAEAEDALLHQKLSGQITQYSWAGKQ